MRCQSSLCKINGCMFPQACPNDSPMTAPEPLPSVPPTEPRKCPACGTKLIPASQAFSEIREHITEAESSGWHDLLENAEGRIEYWKAQVASLSSQLERQREEMALREVEVAESLAAAGRVVEGYTADLVRNSNELSALRAQLERQREEIERLKASGVNQERSTASSKATA